MKIALGADHAGFLLKDQIRDRLSDAGHQIQDFGTNSAESTDYPDYAAAVGKAVAGGGAEFGILVCGSGAGMAIAANKIPGIRAALGTTPEAVSLIRAHNNANVLTLGARFLEPEQAAQLVDTFLSEPFQGGRHERRIEKIAHMEEEA